MNTPLLHSRVSTLLVKLKTTIKTAHFEVNHHCAFDQTDCLQLSQKVVQCSSFPILGREYFYQFSVRKTFTLPY